MSIEPIVKKGMCVGVMGLGVTGRSAARYCLKCGARLLVSDTRTKEQFSKEELSTLEQPGVELETGGHTASFLEKSDCVFVSPGIPPTHEVLQSLQKKNIPVVGELEIAAPHLDVPVIGVTGTNGKTTVTSLIGKMLEADGRQVFVGGNIGTPLFDYLSGEEKVDVIVLELSSFQLHMAGGFTPDIGVLLNITPDHITWHGSIEQYVSAKLNLFRNQKDSQLAILSGDDRILLERQKSINSRVYTFGAARGNSASWSDSRITVERREGSSCTFDLEGSSLNNDIGAANSAAAILAVKELGVTDTAIEKTLKSFTLAAHRLEEVAEYKTVRYVNDSKATNTGAVLAALNQLKTKAVLIAGGKEKGEDYSVLKEPVKAHTSAVVLIGEAAESMEKEFVDTVPIYRANTMMDAVQIAAEKADEGQTVLLSPACASFDMFTSYGHRGDEFSKAVKEMITNQQTEG